jgi:hypothetical protein
VHIAVARPISPQQREHGGVGDKRRNADRPHRNGMRHRSTHSVPDHDANDPHPERAHGRAFDQGRQRPIAKYQTYNEQADPIAGAVTEKIERIGLQRDRARCEAGPALKKEHAGIDRQGDPEHPLIGPILLTLRRFFTLVAAMRAHDLFPEQRLCC